MGMVLLHLMFRASLHLYIKESIVSTVFTSKNGCNLILELRFYRY